MINWDSQENQLLLNPRLAPDQKALAERAWQEHALGPIQAHLGIMTSGSSGSSLGKLIFLSKTAILESARAVNEHLSSTSDDVWLKALPEFHVGGLGILARANLSGASVEHYLADKWQPLDFHRFLGRTKTTLLSLVPTQLFDLVGLELKAPANLRAVIIGGGRLEESLESRALALGWPLRRSYGLTECCSQVATATEPGSQDLEILSHCQIRISNAGRIQIRSRSLLSGQVDFEQSNFEFKDPKSDGWYETADRGSLRVSSDGSNCVEVFGRDSDFIKVGGEGVSVAALEARLERLKSLSGAVSLGDIAICAARDDRLGAKIVLLTDTNFETAEQIKSLFNQGVAPFEAIKSVHVLESLPRSPLGKLLRGQALRAVGLEPVANI